MDHNLRSIRDNPKIRDESEESEQSRRLTAR